MVRYRARGRGDTRMVDIEKMNGRYRHSNPVGDLQSTAGAFASDLLELAELQGKLLRADGESAVRQSIGSAVTLVISCTCLMSCLPVVVFGLASAVAYSFEIETWVAQLAVGGSFSLFSILAAAIAFRNFSRISLQFKRSLAEFSKTLEWTKNVFKGVSSR